MSSQTCDLVVDQDIRRPAVGERRRPTRFRLAQQHGCTGQGVQQHLRIGSAGRVVPPQADPGRAGRARLGVRRVSGRLVRARTEAGRGEAGGRGPHQTREVVEQQRRFPRLDVPGQVDRLPGVDAADPGETSKEACVGRQTHQPDPAPARGPGAESAGTP